MSEQKPRQSPPAESSHPAPLLLHLAARLLGGANRDYIIGDLLEAFEADSVCGGRRSANRKLLRELSSTVFWDVLSQARTSLLRLMGRAPVRIAVAGGAIAHRPDTHRRAVVGASILLAISLPFLYLASGARIESSPRLHLQSLEPGVEVASTTGAPSVESAILLKSVSVEGWSTREGPILGLVSVSDAKLPVPMTVILGRRLGSGDVPPEAAIAVVLEGGWRTRLKGARDVVGSILTVDGRAVTIVGVVSMDIDWPGPEPQLWIARTREEIAAFQGL